MLLQSHDAHAPPSCRASHCRQGNERTFNIEIVLATNIVSDHVFLEELLPLTRLDQLLDYMYDNVAHVEPCKIGSARSASPAFMCLYRLAMFAPAARDMMRVLNSRDSVYIRAIGFLLLRYAAAPEEVWTWFEPYLDDATPFQPSGESKGRTLYVHAAVLCMLAFASTLPPSHHHSFLCTYLCARACAEALVSGFVRY